MKGLVVKDKLGCISYFFAATTVAFFLIMMMPNYSALAYSEHGGGDKSSPSGTMYFRVLKGDLNVCSPNYKHNVTICQTVMKNEELLPYVGGVSDNIQNNNSTSSTNSTNSSSYPPLSVDPEMVITEEQLQVLLTNSSSNPLEEAAKENQNGTGSIQSDDTQPNNIGKIYVDDYADIEPLVVEQPLENEINIANYLQRPWENNPQTFFMNNHTASNEFLDIEDPVLMENPIRQQLDHQDLGPTKAESRASDNKADNPKADTSNSYSSIPIGNALPIGN